MHVLDRDRDIRTRSELIAWLTEAAELEHSLLIQYLFAGYTLKKFPDERLTDPQTEVTRNWESLMLHVARQEMAHLGMVSNLLTAVGGRPHFKKPNFPQPVEPHRPFPFLLEKFSGASLLRFIRAEQPQPQAMAFTADAVPHEPSFDYTGELYRKIEQGFFDVAADLAGRHEELFIGPPAGQDEGTWSTSVTTQGITDLDTAKRTIAQIIREGEGAPVESPTSHFSIFTSMAKELSDAQVADPGFAPARMVASNPMTRVHPDANGNVTLITNESARQLAGLFNTIYASTLLMLMQYFDFSGESDDERVYLRNAIRQTMSEILRPIAEILTTLPVGADTVGERAGPGFEFYDTSLDISGQLAPRWIVLHERFRQESLDAASLVNDFEFPARLSYVREGIDLRLRNLETLLMASQATSFSMSPLARRALRPHQKPMRVKSTTI
jgi:rubrerythrin